MTTRESFEDSSRHEMTSSAAVGESQRGSNRLIAALLAIWERAGGVRRAAVAAAVLAAASGLATVLTFVRAGPEGPDPGLVLGLLYLDIALLLLLGALVAHRLVRIWVQRRKGLAGSRLHVRMALLFSVIAVAPTILVSLFSLLMFDYGVREWFSERVGTAVKSSQEIAESYLAEHRQSIRADALALAAGFNRDLDRLLANPAHFTQIVRAQAAYRNLTDAVVFEQNGRVLARTALSFSFEFDRLPIDTLIQSRNGEVAILTNDADDRIRAIVKLDRYIETYLFVARFVDPSILTKLDRTTEAVDQYLAIEGRRFDIQLTFLIAFGVVALLLLMAAVWIGLTLANRLAAPVVSLTEAAEQVREGDLSARVNVVQTDDELGTLSLAFNRMTEQLETQRRDLLEAARIDDERRRFTEAVLGGVSAGVVGLDSAGLIDLPNRAAADLLDMSVATMSGQRMTALVPELAPLFEQVNQQPKRLAESQIEIRRGDRRLVLLARVAAEIADGYITGYVVTFDDITELLSAQRLAAWADVARRIAHEIKNPLTPIQLSAERLKRKYLKQIEDDPETFVTCTDTIVRQVTDIGRMVNEFSNFARMPAPTFRSEDLSRLVGEQVALQRGAHPEISLTVQGTEEAHPLTCDSGQIRQALTNLLQNAIDAVGARLSGEGQAEPGVIDVNVSAAPSALSVSVADNGTGLPSSDRHRLTEPYVTSRTKGTGLGLAIVKKIMEDHGGRIELSDRPGGGAIVTLTFAERGSEETPLSNVPPGSAERTPDGR